MLTASPITLDVTQSHGDTVFPYLLQPEQASAQSGSMQSGSITLEDAVAWAAQHRDELLGLATQHGAVALRGFPFPDVDSFDALIQTLQLNNFPYKESLSNAVRVNRTPRVFSANEAPPEVRIFFHHEMAQTPLYPRYIMFYCEIAPEQGGATPLCRSDVLWERLKQRAPDFAHDCQTKGLRYSNVMPGHDDPNSGMGRSWQKTLGVEDRESAQQRLQALGYSFEWLADDCLRATTPVLPAVLPLGDGRHAFFNQLIAAYCGWKDERNDPSDAIRFGDGSKLDPNGVQTAVEIADELTYPHQWQVGDAVILDNTVVMHARSPFVGTRKILASLAERQDNAFVPIAS